jgi:riboflavin synthase
MFTGIVTDVGTITAVTDRKDVRRITVATAYDPATISIGASISCAGICLTVVELHRAAFDVEAAPETLAVTNAKEWAVGTRLNLERALKVGDELGGHIVSGHVDGLAQVIDRKDLGETTRFVFEAPADLAKFIAPKGSVCLDGTSLTVNGVQDQQFDCLLIPHTLAVTTWGERQVGDRVHLEVDTVARYVARLYAAR